MKQINPILRTLCITALLCMTSVSAFAYKTYDGDGRINVFSLSMGDDKILVVTEDATVDDLFVDEGYALVVLPDVTLTVTGKFDNEGTIYFIGQLRYESKEESTNLGTINVLGKFSISEIIDRGTINYNFNPFQIVPAKAPSSTQNGWEKYWEMNFVCGEDSYHEGYYEQPYYKIEDLEAWKKGDGKLEYNAPTKIDCLQPDSENDYVGWKGYYKQVCTANKGTNYTFYAEDEAFTKPIPDLEAWKIDDGILCGLVIGSQSYIFGRQDGELVYDGDLTFNDKDAYKTHFDFTVDGSISYSRTFKATGVWQSWFVPFDVTVYKMNQAEMEVAEIAGVLMDENKQPYIAFAKMTSTDAIVKANTPYVVKAQKQYVDMRLVGPDICIRKSTNAELEAKRLTVQSSYDTFTFGGNYQPTNGYANEWYALNTSGVLQKMGEGTQLAPQRFWMTIDTRTDTPYYTGGGADAKEFINMTVLGDDDPTGITSYENESESKGVIYNIHGQKVTRIQSGQVYIMNGKKYLAR